MPRPGPRPYECVRRAWHSDRHKPIRGSIIQQIFRVVNEAHSSTTKENKEWQEKLPVVVLKAEEIMYSKANSEAEYTNLDTLWDRVNDAINTIIRREETNETGDLLPPCVEAALNLGCVPVRASRSQRHCNPRSYLTPRTQEPSCAPARVVDKASDERRPQLLPLQPGTQLNFTRTPVATSAKFLSQSNIYVNQNDNPTAPQNHSFSPENILTGHNQVPMNTNTALNSGSVYPLYYGTHYRSEEYQSGTQIPEILHSKTIYVGTPVVTSAAEPSKQNCFSYNGTKNVLRMIPQVDVVDTRENQRQQAECDLSLRLGTFSHQFGSTEKSLAPETEDADSSSSQEGRKLNELRPSISKEFCFFPGKSTCDPFESSSRMWSSGGEGQNLEAAVRKGKEPFSSNDEDGRFCWQPDVPSNWFSSQITRPGS
ncbi:Coactivator CBP, KIX domain containing protein [Trema orientale]|uniref:Coactivator CBP, KIX domain containing protein n=1 Tax=Trema orientale TaxID=63057 RepID=A0A2P5F8Z6_TREOI|nr:Coactivator CBP, KIX domain containing protein [Trema orientale]